MSALRILAFGDLPSETWGVSWMSDRDPVRVAVRAGATAAFVDANLDAAEDGAWQLAGDGLSLVLRPTIPALTSYDSEEALERQDQLCEVEGRVQTDAGDAEISCLGWRSSAEGSTDLDQLDSVRFLAAWLGPRAGFSLTAMRPRKARGHEADVVAAVVVEEPPARVVDPRLSTTYTDAGMPARAGLELWVETEGEEASEEESSLQYPRRAAGQAAGAALDWNHGNLALHASLVHWHSQGQEGPGIYLLSRQR